MYSGSSKMLDFWLKPIIINAIQMSHKQCSIFPKFLEQAIANLWETLSSSEVAPHSRLEVMAFIEVDQIHIVDLVHAPTHVNPKTLTLKFLTIKCRDPSSTTLSNKASRICNNSIWNSSNLMWIWAMANQWSVLTCLGKCIYHNNSKSSHRLRSRWLDHIKVQACSIS